MFNVHAALIILLLGLVVDTHPSVAPRPLPAPSTVCDTAGREVAMTDIGSPDANGVTLSDVHFTSPVDRVAYRFVVAAPRTGFVYVGDQWFDLDLALYSITKSQTLACWQTIGARARSERHQQRQIQFIRPDEQIVEGLEPGVYVLAAGLAPGAAFDPIRGFTIRIATGPPLCGGLNPPNRPNPGYPGLVMRADDAWYQLGMSVQPDHPGPFDLVSFNAFVSPPYTDLFDFTWDLDGQRIPGADTPTLQLPASRLLGSSPATHAIRVTARGAREYPDPEQSHTPPTLTVTCVLQTGQ